MDTCWVGLCHLHTFIRCAHGSSLTWTLSVLPLMPVLSFARLSIVSALLGKWTYSLPVHSHASSLCSSLLISICLQAHSEAGFLGANPAPAFCRYISHLPPPLFTPPFKIHIQYSSRYRICFLTVHCLCRAHPTINACTGTNPSAE
jgi:hypothetical protein